MYIEAPKALVHNLGECWAESEANRPLMHHIHDVNQRPACYRKGGPVTVTDANLVLGRLVPSHFPAIFGPSQSESLNLDASLTGLQKLVDQVNESLPNGETMTVDEVAYGFIKVANEAMCRPIRGLTQAKGYDTAQHILACFGGAVGRFCRTIAVYPFYVCLRYVLQKVITHHGFFLLGRTACLRYCEVTGD